MLQKAVETVWHNYNVQFSRKYSVDYNSAFPERMHSGYVSFKQKYFLKHQNHNPTLWEFNGKAWTDCMRNINTEVHHIIGLHMKYNVFSEGKFHLYDTHHRIPIIWRFVLLQKVSFKIQSLLAIPAIYQKRAPKAFSIKPRELCRSLRYFPTIF